MIRLHRHVTNHNSQHCLGVKQTREVSPHLDASIGGGVASCLNELSTHGPRGIRGLRDATCRSLRDATSGRNDRSVARTFIVLLSPR